MPSTYVLYVYTYTFVRTYVRFLIYVSLSWSWREELGAHGRGARRPVNQLRAPLHTERLTFVFLDFLKGGCVRNACGEVAPHSI